MSKFQLRPYQETMVSEILGSLAQHNSVVGQLPTGGGKTMIFSAITHEFIKRNEDVLLLSHREELVNQGAGKLEFVSGKPVGIIKAGYPDHGDRLIQSASVQSLVRRLHRYPPDRFGAIIVDECHHATAKTYRKTLDYFQGAYTLGFTATPCRGDGAGLGDLFSHMVTGPTIRELIEAGYLSPYKYLAAEKSMVVRGAKVRRGDYTSKSLARLNPRDQLAADLVSSYCQHCDGLRCLIFAIDRDYSKAIAAMYQAAGIPAIHLDGETPSEVRKAALEAFQAGEIKVVSNVGLFTEGTDLPAIEALQMARPTKSLGLFLQMVGRVLRPAPGKDEALIIDHGGNWERHGLPCGDRTWTLEGVQKPKRAKRLVKNAEGEIVEWEPIEIVQTTVTTREIQPGNVDHGLQGRSPELDGFWKMALDELLEEREARGYQKGWVGYRLKDLNAPLGVWKAAASELGYKPGWAWYKWRESRAA
ncbi:DEAD/DEAH box helicase [Picosynechococcus sp. PCC 7117]|uniref:DEAD/DEAH box helicase n=1 Tax=Picosynechococcus sp. PCC 7117 TaxID=195498 RepID=UPI000A024BB5|nr:DEAD/DEAH box helicase [Picosynechococcus sp. PCC 7117]